MINSNMANREVCDLIFVDYSTHEPFLNLDFANVSTTELTGESVFAYGGKGHPKRIQFAGERSGTLTIETQIQTVKLWQMISGGELSDEVEFLAREEFDVNANDTSAEITLKGTPVEDSIHIYAGDDDCGIKINAYTSSTSESGAYKLTVTKAKGTDKLIVYYMKKVSTGVQRINIKSTSFPKNFTVYGDTIMKTEDDKVLPYKLTAYKVAPQSTMSLGFTNNGDPSSITITCDLMADDEGNILDLALIENTGNSDSGTGESTGA